MKLMKSKKKIAHITAKKKYIYKGRIFIAIVCVMNGKLIDTYRE